MSDVSSDKRPLTAAQRHVAQQEMARQAAQQVGTHQTHCCKRHGCKYGNDDCPVEDGTVEQEYACEQCQSSKYVKLRIEALKKELEWSESLEARGVKIYDDLDSDYYDED